MWWKSIIAGVLSFFASDAMKKIQKCIPAIVAEVEKAMADNKITAAERKKIAMNTIDIAAKEFNVPINGITRWVISTLIDKIASVLPSKDINVSSYVKSAISLVK